MSSEIYTLELPRIDYNLESQQNDSGSFSAIFDKNGLSYIHRLPAKAYEDAISTACHSANSYRFGNKEFKGIPILWQNVTLIENVLDLSKESIKEL